jgi:hypothetical protein
MSPFGVLASPLFPRVRRQLGQHKRQARRFHGAAREPISVLRAVIGSTRIARAGRNPARNVTPIRSASEVIKVCGSLAQRLCWTNPDSGIASKVCHFTTGRPVINRLLDGFEGKLTSSKYAKLTKCSQDTAYRDIQALVERHVLDQIPRGASAARRGNIRLPLQKLRRRPTGIAGGSRLRGVAARLNRAGGSVAMTCPYYARAVPMSVCCAGACAELSWHLRDIGLEGRPSSSASETSA